MLVKFASWVSIGQRFNFGNYIHALARTLTYVIRLTYTNLEFPTNNKLICKHYKDIYLQ